MNPKPAKGTSYPGGNASLLISLGVFLASVGLMAWLRFVVYGDRFVPLTYALPLLICLWRRDRILLWSMATALAGMAAYKAMVLMPSDAEALLPPLLHWSMQVVNILSVAIAVHVVAGLTDGLRQRNLELDCANAQLEEKNRQITRANEELQAQAEELQAQAEELAQQNEEILQQTEELAQQNEEIQQQSEELQVQSEEVQRANANLLRRETVLESLLGSLDSLKNFAELPNQVCESVIGLFDGAAVAAAVLERQGDELLVVAQAGDERIDAPRLALAGSFASIVMELDRTASVEDLALRPDLMVPHPGGRPMRSLLAAPLRIDGVPMGTVEIYSGIAQPWTAEHFRMAEWAAAQCSLILGIRRLQQRLAASNADLEKIVEERTSELREMVNELEHFSYTITHDMRAPLRAMSGFAGLLGEQCADVLDDRGREHLRRISTAAARMDRLITDALSYSRTVRQELEIAPLDPEALLRGIIESYPIFQPPHAQVVIEGKLPRILANEAGLTQCFSNLLGNAVKFVRLGETPRVKVWAEHRGSVVRLYCEDNGIGISPEMRSRVFGMFQRLNKEYEGTGIGLALVRKMTERMGGSVGVEAGVATGSRFWLELRAAV
jgi:signal transduction histidine kinase